MKTTYEIPVRNDETEDIPAFAVMQPTAPVEVAGQLVFPVLKPNAVGWPRVYLINGPHIIPEGGSGSGTWARADNPAVVLREAVAVSYGDSGKLDWGVVDGEWALQRLPAGGYFFLANSATDNTKGVFHSEGSVEPFVCSLNAALNTAGSFTASAQICEQDPTSKAWVGIGRNIDVYWSPPHANAEIDSGDVWVQRNIRTGIYNVLTANQFYLSPESAAHMAASAPGESVAVVGVDTP